jgi:hypothetical protein
MHAFGVSKPGLVAGWPLGRATKHHAHEVVEKKALAPACVCPVPGANVTGIFSFDLTYDQVKKLRATQPRAYRNQMYNGLYPVQTT